MRTYTLTLTDPDGKPVSKRILRVFDDELYSDAEKYRAMVVARELLKDAEAHSKKCG